MLSLRTLSPAEKQPTTKAASIQSDVQLSIWRAELGRNPWHAFGAVAKRAEKGARKQVQRGAEAGASVGEEGGRHTQSSEPSCQLIAKKFMQIVSKLRDCGQIAFISCNALSLECIDQMQNVPQTIRSQIGVVHNLGNPFQ